MTKTVHANRDSKHIVAINALRVRIVPDTVGYLAQGIEIDYFAAGASEADARERFQEGFALTVEAHLKKFGCLDRFLKNRRSVVMPVGADKQCWNFSQVSFHDIPKLNAASSKLPFDRFEFATPNFAIHSAAYIA